MNRYATTFALVCLLICGCSIQINGLNVLGKPGSGTIITEVRELPTFSNVKYGGSGSVRVVSGDVTEVAITCDDNLLEYISTEVQDDTLHISTTTGIAPTGEHHYEITCPRLSSLRLHGSGSATVDELATDDFELRLSGSGSAKLAGVRSNSISIRTSGSGGVRIAGMAKSVSITTSGSGSVDAQELTAQSVEARTSGSGSVQVHASDSFRGSTSGSGGIWCYGSPIERSESSSGSGGIQYSG